MITMIAFKGTIRDFWQSPHCAANCLQHVSSSGPGAIVCKSCATQRTLIMCNMSCCVPHGTKGQLSYWSLTEFKITFIIASSCWLNHSTDEGREETRVPGKKTLVTSFRKCHILQPEDSGPKRTCTIALVPIHPHYFPKPFPTTTVIQSRNVTTCKVAKQSHTQKSHQYGDSHSSSWGMKEKK